MRERVTPELELGMIGECSMKPQQLTWFSGVRRSSVKRDGITKPSFLAISFQVVRKRETWLGIENIKRFFL